jgi:mannosyltransferase
MTSAATRSAPDMLTRAGLAAAMLLGAFLLAFQLGEKGFWLDEAISVERAGASWPELWHEVTTTQANMALYYIALHSWLVWPAAGATETAVRSLSVIFALATLPVVYLLTARVADRKAGLIAVLLLAGNGFFIRYGQEARGYSLAMLLVTWSSYQLLRSLDRPSARAWAGYALVSALALYAHLFAGLVVLGHAVFVLTLGWRRSPMPWRLVGFGWGLLGLLAVPLALFVIFRDVGQLDWVPPLRGVDALDVLRALSGDAGWFLLGLYVAACGVTGVTSLRAPADDSPTPQGHMALLAIWFLTPLLLALAISVVKPIFQPRYLLVALPPFVMLAAIGLSRIRRQAVAYVFAGAVFWQSAGGVRAWYDAPDRQHWRSAVEFVMSRAQPGDAIGFYVYSARVPFEYYVHRLERAQAGAVLVNLTDKPWVAGNLQPEPSREILDGLSARHRRVWLVRLQDGAPPGSPLRRFEQFQQIHSALTASHAATTTATFPGGIRIQRYDRAAR